MPITLNHKHMIISAIIGNPSTDPVFYEKWLTELVEKIEMKILMGPFSVRVDYVGNTGCTGMVVIETSHASIHVFEAEKPGNQHVLKMDVYSCADFDAEIIMSHLSPFGVIGYDYMVIDRNGVATVIDSVVSYN